MGLLDFLGGGTPAQKAQKLKAKVTQKYGDPATRQGAIQSLGKLKSPDTVGTLMQRFTFAVEPQTTDADEKEVVFGYITDLKADAVPAVVEFLKKSDAASSWAVKILEAVLPPNEVLTIAIGELERLGAEYTRDPEKKEVLLHFLQGKSDARIRPVVVPFLHDMSDDVKMAALRTLAAEKFVAEQEAAFEPTRAALLTLLTTDDTAKRVQTACITTLVEAGYPVQGFREKVEGRLADGYFIDKSGVVKKRGA